MFHADRYGEVHLDLGQGNMQSPWMLMNPRQPKMVYRYSIYDYKYLLQFNSIEALGSVFSANQMVQFTNNGWLFVSQTAHCHFFSPHPGCGGWPFPTGVEITLLCEHKDNNWIHFHKWKQSVRVPRIHRTISIVRCTVKVDKGDMEWIMSARWNCTHTWFLM